MELQGKGVASLCRGMNSGCTWGARLISETQRQCSHMHVNTYVCTLTDTCPWLVFFFELSSSKFFSSKQASAQVRQRVSSDIFFSYVSSTLYMYFSIWKRNSWLYASREKNNGYLWVSVPADTSHLNSLYTFTFIPFEANLPLELWELALTERGGLWDLEKKLSC